jgi:hypothetical protein
MFNSREWLPCPPGEWHRLASLLRYYRRVAIALNLLVVIVTIMAVGLGGWAVASMLPPSSPSWQSTPVQSVPCQTAPCHPDQLPPPAPNNQPATTGGSTP